MPRRGEDDTVRIVLIATFGALGVACMGCALPFAALAIPNFVEMQYRAKRAEVPANVDGLKTAEMGYHAAFDEYVAVEPHPRRPEFLGKESAPWRGNKDFDELGWAPDGDVRGTYWVEVSPDGSDFTVFGMGDMDGDGVQRMASAGFVPFRGDTYGDIYAEDAQVPGVFLDTHKPHQRIKVLRRASMPSVIVETHHAWVADEVALWEQPVVVLAFADALYQGVSDHLR